ncbi:MAG: hypothetical protein ACYDD1_17050 [Caulobacteraceae bacterium]
MDELTVWIERQRLRVFSSEERAFTYTERLRYHAVCPACLAKLVGGRRVEDVENRRAVISLVSVAIAGVALAVALPFIMPTLLSAFWQTR